MGSFCMSSRPTANGLLWFKFNLWFEFLKPYGHYHFSLQKVQSKLPAGMPDSTTEWRTLKRPVSRSIYLPHSLGYPDGYPQVVNIRTQEPQGGCYFS